MSKFSEGVFRSLRVFKNKAFTLTLASLIILALAVAGWWHYIYSTPTNTFNRMLATMLSTQSVVKQVKQASDVTGQRLDQNTRLVSTPVQAVNGTSVLNQGGDTITTEIIGTPQHDYVRYIDIKTDQKSVSGGNFDFSSVLGVWGKSESTTDQVQSTQFYSQNLFGVIPVANLPVAQRNQLLNQIRDDKVYSVDYGATEVGRRDSRPTYTYPVSVNPVAYVRMLKTFAGMLGQKQLEQVDPEQYSSAAPLKFELVVDTWSGQLVEIRYTEQARTEIYKSYGVKADVRQPKDTIPISELQNRLQQLQ